MQIKNLQSGVSLGQIEFHGSPFLITDMVFTNAGDCLFSVLENSHHSWISVLTAGLVHPLDGIEWQNSTASRLALSPDQTMLYASNHEASFIYTIGWLQDLKNPIVQRFGELEKPFSGNAAVGGMCVDTNGWLYVATSLGIQVLDQAGRVNFILPTPKPALDVCFGGKDLSELFIACGDTIYKRPTKAKGVVSGQQPPIMPPAPKL